MKNSFVKFSSFYFLSLLTLFSFSSQAKLLLVDDIGVIGPEGKVFYYYVDAGMIFSTICHVDTVLSQNPMVARKNCIGLTSWNSIGNFKKLAINLVLNDQTNLLNLDLNLKNEFIKYYNTTYYVKTLLDKFKSELEAINNFNTAYGSENGRLARKAEIEKILLEESNRVNAIQKLEIKIDNVINLISENKVNLTTFSQNQNTFEYNLLSLLNNNTNLLSNFSSCGLKGTIEERIADCKKISSTTTLNVGGINIQVETVMITPGLLPKVVYQAGDRLFTQVFVTSNRESDRENTCRELNFEYLPNEYWRNSWSFDSKYHYTIWYEIFNEFYRNHGGVNYVASNVFSVVCVNY